MEAADSPSALTRWLPGLGTARTYQRRWLLTDLASGLALAAILVPVGMGYAEAAGLPAIYGLYATIVPLLVYALVGPSRVFILGPDSALAGLIGATIAPMVVADPSRAPALAAFVGVAGGIICLLVGLARLGFVTELLSKPIRYGYLNGIALTVLVGQLPGLFGFSVHADGFLAETQGFAQGVAAGLTNTTALAVGLVTLAIIVLARRLDGRIPGVLLGVVVATVASAVLGLAARGVAVIGPLPQGLPAFAVPFPNGGELVPLAAGAAAIALVSLADTTVLSRTFAARRGEEVDQDREISALGAANVVSGFFQGFSVSASASRTTVASDAGARSQLAGVVAALAVGAMLVVLPGLLADLPRSALAAVVIAAIIGLIEVAGVIRLYRLRISEFALSLVCFLGVLLFGVIQGIFIAVALALMAFVWRAWRPHSAVLGRVEGRKGYHDVSRHPEALRIPGLVLFRWDAPLFFANSEMFVRAVEDAIRDSPTPVRWVVVAAEPVTDIDVTAADMLDELVEELRARGIQLAFAELKGPVKDRLRGYGMGALIAPGLEYSTVGTAVDGYLQATGETWQDWEDRGPAPGP